MIGPGFRGRVTLFSDYGAGWPLWLDNGLSAPADWDLSPALLDRLAAWDRLFADHFHWELGWRDPEAGRRYREEAPALVRALERELPDADVQIRLWC